MSVHNRISQPKVRPFTPKINRTSPLGPYVVSTWPFRNISEQLGGESSTLFDYSGHGYHGIANEVDRIITPFGWGLDFVGSSNIQIFSNNGTTFPKRLTSTNGNLTWMFLIKFDNPTGSVQVIIEKGDETSGVGWVFRINSSGRLEYKNNDIVLGRTVVANTILTADTWYRVGISIGALASVADDPEIAIYLDGKKDGFFSAGDGSEQNWSDDEIVIGKRAGASANYLDGQIADIVAYNIFFSEAMASYDYENLFNVYQDNEPFATDLSFIEIIEGGFIAGGVADVFFVYSPITPTQANSGQFLAGKGINQGPFNDWQNSKNIIMGLDSASTAFLEDADGAKTSHLIATNFNLNVPSGLTILGIRVTINGKSSNAGRGEFNEIWLTKNGTSVAGDIVISTEIGGVQQDKSFGDETDLWGETWTADEISDDGFGFAISFISGPGSGTSVISIYQMRIDVTALDINSQTIVNLGGFGLSPQTFNETVAGGVLVNGTGPESEEQTEPVSGGMLVGGELAETMIFNPTLAGGTLAGGEGIEEISGTVEGGALIGGRATTLYDEIGIGGTLLGTTGEWTMHRPDGGAKAGGAAIVEITPFLEGGTILGGKAVTGFTQRGGIVLSGEASNVNSFTATPEGGILVGELADVTSIKAFIPTGGMIVGGIVLPQATYTITDVGTGSLLAGGKPDESPSVFGGSLVGGEASSFVSQVTRGGALAGGEGIETISVAVGFEGIVLGGEAIAQTIKVEPVAGGILVGGFARPIIVPFHEGGSLVGGTAIPTANYTIADVAGGIFVDGRLIVGIQPPASGGVLANGKAFITITETPFGGAVLGGAGSQTFDEAGLGGALASGDAESFIDYSAHGGATVGGLATLYTSIIEHPAGGTLVDGRAQRSTSIIEHPVGGSLVIGNHLLHYNFIGGVNFDDTVSYGGPITMGGAASIVRPTIRFIGDGPVVISGTAITSFTFKDFEYVPQSAVATVFITGTANIILTINDQECLTANQQCKIVDKQTGKRRIHCTIPELFAPYCGDLRRGNQCSNDAAVLPAIILCRQKLLVQQDILDIKNKTVFRNRGRVI